MHWSQWTFLDFVFAAVILFSTIFALIKGLAREVIRLSSLIGGFFLAAFYYPVASGWMAKLVSSEIAAGLIGFMAIFFSSLLIGAVVMFLVNRFLKITSLLIRLETGMQIHIVFHNVLSNQILTEIIRFHR